MQRQKKKKRVIKYAQIHGPNMQEEAQDPLSLFLGSIVYASFLSVEAFLEGKGRPVQSSRWVGG